MTTTPYITFTNAETGNALSLAETEIAIKNQSALISERHASSGFFDASFYTVHSSTTHRERDLHRLMDLKAYRDYLREVEFEATSAKLRETSEALSITGNGLTASLVSLAALQAEFAAEALS